MTAASDLRSVQTLLWRLIRGDRERVATPDREVDREFRKIARRLGPLDPPGDD